MDDVASAAVLERDAEYRARLEASRGIGLDFVPYQGRQVLRLIYRLDSRGLDGWALVADGKAIGAWLRIPGRGLIFRLDRHEEALAAVADPRVRPSPTLDPNPIGDRPNLVQHFRLGEATDMWLKGAIRGGLTRDDAVRIRILAALDTEVAVERVGRDLVPPDDANTILVVFDTKDGLVPLRYHVDQHRVYIQERGVLFAPPPAFVAALEPFYQPIQVPGTLSKSIRPTESPAASASLPAAR